MDASQLAQSYEGGDIIPIYTPQQFSEVGTGAETYVAETGKVYTFGTDKTYMFYGQSEDITTIIQEAIAESGVSSGSSSEQVDVILNYTVTADSENSGARFGTITTTNSEGEKTNVSIDEYKELIVCLKFDEEFITGIEGYGQERIRVKVPILKNLGVATTNVSAMVGFEFPAGLAYTSTGALGVIYYVDDSTTYTYIVYGVK